MKHKSKMVIFFLTLSLIFCNLVLPVFGYTDLITDYSGNLSTLQIETHNEAGNQLAGKGIYVYYKIFPRNTNSSVYDTIRSEYFEKYTYHKETDKIAIIYYFIEDPSYDNGCMYYYDDNAGLVKFSTIDEINELMIKYNKKKDIANGTLFIYNNILHEIADTEGIQLNNYKIIEAKYGGLNFIMIPTMILLSIVITGLFAFRKR